MTVETLKRGWKNWSILPSPKMISWKDAFLSLFWWPAGSSLLSALFTYKIYCFPSFIFVFFIMYQEIECDLVEVKTREQPNTGDAYVIPDNGVAVGGTPSHLPLVTSQVTSQCTCIVQAIDLPGQGERSAWTTRNIVRREARVGK